MDRRRICAAAACLAVLAPVPAPAEAPPFASFTFKRLAPPTGTGPRITVQITEPLPIPVRLVSGPARMPRLRPPPRPIEVAAAPKLPRDVPPASMADTPAAPSRHAEWFWAEISPAPAPGRGPARLIAATRHVAEGGGRVRTPAFETVAGIVRAHGPEILRHSVGTRVSPALAVAVIAVESAGRANAVSHAGATGLMQLMPATAERFGVTDRRSPGQSIMGGIAYLDWLLGHFDGDPLLALAAYNAGEGAVARHGGVPPYRETREYVPKVLAAWRVARALCATPPVLASDGCAFALPS